MIKLAGFILLVGMYVVHTFDDRVYVDATAYQSVTIKACHDGYKPYYTGFEPPQHGRDGILHVACLRIINAGKPDESGTWSYQDIIIR